MTQSRVQQLVNFWQMKAVFQIGLVEACEVNADSPLVIFLFYLFYHSVHMLGCGPSSSLFHWLDFGEDVQLMFDEIGVYPRHLLGCPCEDLNICCKKLDELGSLLFLQVCTSEKETIRVWLIQFIVYQVFLDLSLRVSLDVF